MSSLRQILRLKALGTSNKKIVLLTGMSKTTILKYLRSAKASGLDQEKLLALSEEEIELILNPDLGEESRLGVLRDQFPRIEKELKRVGVNRLGLWRQYKAVHPDGYNYSQFCYHFKRWRGKQDVVMHFEHKAGDKLYVDYTGKKLFIVDRATGEQIEAEVFVAVLGASQYTFVEATLSQKKEDFIGSVENSFYYFYGVPAAVVPDNLKAAVTKSSRYEPVLNQSFEDFGSHYGTAILPARAYKPRDKALVEGAVRIVYSRIFAPLRDRVFFSLESLNEAILELLVPYNAVHFQGKNHSRRDLFDQIEKTALSPLAHERYEIKHYARATVQKNSHIRLPEDGRYFSVPYRYIGERLKVIYTRKQVEVYSGGKRISFHKRTPSRSVYSSNPEHLPSTHQFVADWHPQKFLSWAKGIGEPAHELVRQVFLSKIHPEQAYKSCAGILGFARTYGKPRLNKACDRALQYQSYNYRTIKNILEKGLDQSPEQGPDGQSSTPDHGNIRGKDYYK